jgi:phosphoglycolate phosphatase-like HAD superfamily hydrolase
VRPTVLLFDVDGTLVLTGGAGRRALSRAFGELAGRPDALDGVDFGGMTDWMLCRAGLRAAGQPDDARTIEVLLERYLVHLSDEVPRSDRYRVLPGVHDVVRAVSGRDGIAVGLGTGNVERGARIKLARGDLDAPFRFGGFGCDHEDRAELLTRGARRGAAMLGRPLDSCRVVVIGDTPRDVDAARRIGAECVGVGTGGHSARELLELGATAAFDDLSARGALGAILEGAA